MRAHLVRVARIAAASALLSVLTSAQQRVDFRRVELGELIARYNAHNDCSVSFSRLARSDSDETVIWVSPGLDASVLADDALFTDLLFAQGLSVTRMRAPSFQALRISSYWREGREKLNDFGPWVELDELLARRGSASRYVRCKLQLESANLQALAENLLDVAWQVNRPWTLAVPESGMLVIGGRAGMVADLALMALAADALSADGELDESIFVPREERAAASPEDELRFASLSELSGRSSHLDWVASFDRTAGNQLAIEGASMDSLNARRGGLLRPLEVPSHRAAEVLAAMLAFERHELRSLSTPADGRWWISQRVAPAPSLPRPLRLGAEADVASACDDLLHDFAVPLHIAEDSDFYATVLGLAETPGFESLRYLPIGSDEGDYVLRGETQEVLQALELRAMIQGRERLGRRYQPPVLVNERELEGEVPSDFEELLMALGEQTGTHFLVHSSATGLSHTVDFSADRDWVPDLGTTWLRMEQALIEAGLILTVVRRAEPRIFGIQNAPAATEGATELPVVYVAADELRELAEQPALWIQTAVSGRTPGTNRLHLKLYKLGVRNEDLLGCDAMLLSGKVADVIEARDLVLAENRESPAPGRRRRR